MDFCSFFGRHFTFFHMYSLPGTLANSYLFTVTDVIFSGKVGKLRLLQYIGIIFHFFCAIGFVFVKFILLVQSSIKLLCWVFIMMGKNKWLQNPEFKVMISTWKVDIMFSFEEFDNIARPNEMGRKSELSNSFSLIFLIIGYLYNCARGPIFITV